VALVGTPGVLAGLRVVEVSAFVAVPLGGMTLAQLGADVIRVDPVGGGLDHGRWPVTEEGTSLYWAGLNKGKRSVALNVRSDAGRDLVRRLVTAPGADAGVVITNLAPRWLAYKDLAEDRADLIMVHLGGSPDGSIAVDYTVNAAAGYPSVTGTGEDVVNHVLPAWDVTAGAMVTTAVLAAERWRSRTGEGCLVELSLADVAFAMVGHLGHVAEVVINDADRPRFGNYLYGSFGKDFTTSDGRRVMVTALTPRQWTSLVAATGTEEAMEALESELGGDLRDEGARFTHREHIASVLERWISDRTLAEVRSIFDEHRVCWGPYQTFRELVEHDVRVAPGSNPMWAVIDQPGVGRHPAPGTPFGFSTIPRRPPVPAPILGADTEAVLEDVLGLGREELASLRAEGVL
jgi:2-methylfumaryl-CoA isomerase